MIVPIGKLNREVAIDKINRITPKGKTPISDSIAMAIDISEKVGKFIKKS